MADENKEDVKQGETVVANEQAQEQTAVTPEAPSTSETKSVEQSNTPEELKSDKPRGESKEKHIPLSELIHERKRRRELQERLDALEAKIKEKEQPNKVKEIMDDLQVDEETAVKLAKHFAPTQQAPDEITVLTDRFRKKAEDVSADYPDWTDLQQDMAEEFQKVYEKNPKLALSESPEKYYFLAKLRNQNDPEKARREGAREVANKVNSKNLATTESAKNGSTKVEDAKPKKFTRAWLKSLSQDEFEKHHAEINAELMRGGFKE